MSHPANVLAAAVAEAGLDSVEGAFAFTGGQELVKSSLVGRRRTRIELTDSAGRRHVLYLKRYEPEGLAGLLRRCWRLYQAYLGPAGREVVNIAAVRSAGIATMEVVRWGEEPGLLAPRRSYLIVTAVPGEALERCVAQYLAAGGEQAGALLAEKLAELAAKLHDAGYIHRDFYASHVFLHQTSGGIELYLIDLARVFRPRWRKFRWRARDLAQLKCSMPPDWVERHWGEFTAAYLGGGDGRLARYNRTIDRKAAAIAGRRARKVRQAQKAMGR